MEEKTEIKRITYTSREGGSRTLDKGGKELKKRKGTAPPANTKEQKKKNVRSGSLQASTNPQSEDKDADNKDN